MQDEQDMPMAAMPEPTDEPKRSVEEYKPSNKEALREYEIRIKFLNRGCIVSVGCKEIAFQDPSEAMAAINVYFTNPWDEQQKWRKILD